MTSRQRAREKAFEKIFQIDFHEQLSVDSFDNDFTKTLVVGVIENIEQIDEKISRHLENWSFDRLAAVEKSILRIATYEIISLDDIPVAVSINEAVELCHKYGDDKSGKFVNGVLSKMIDKE